jgi:hypothetical protein
VTTTGILIHSGFSDFSVFETCIQQLLQFRYCFDNYISKVLDIDSLIAILFDFKCLASIGICFPRCESQQIKDLFIVDF